MSALQSMVRAYFENEPASHEIFSDYLQDWGQDRLRHVDGSSARLRLVIERFLNQTETNLLACDFAQHAVENVCSKKGQSVKRGVLNSIELIRTWVVGRKERDKLFAKRQMEKALYKFSSHRHSAFKPRSFGLGVRSADHAVRLLFNNVPFTVMMRAQYTSENELLWQMEHTIEVITKKLEQLETSA